MRLMVAVWGVYVLVVRLDGFGWWESVGIATVAVLGILAVSRWINR